MGLGVAGGSGVPSMLRVTVPCGIAGLTGVSVIWIVKLTDWPNVGAADDGVMVIVGFLRTISLMLFEMLEA